MSDDELPLQEGYLPPRLRICRGCGCHVMPNTELCPHCGANVPKLQRQQDEALAQLEAVRQRLAALLGTPEG